jgi:transcriptional regulator with XRE-family HTH domain
MELGARIAGWRNAKGWSRRDLADKLGLTLSALCLWERVEDPKQPNKRPCRPSQANMEKLVVVLGLRDLAEFYGNIPKPKKPAAKKPVQKRAAA